MSGKSLSIVFNSYLEELLEYPDHSSWNVLYDRYDITIGVAYSCPFDTVDGRTLLTAIYSTTCLTSITWRIATLPYLVASFYAIHGRGYYASFHKRCPIFVVV